MLFETERLRVRKLQTEDLEEFHDLQGNEKVMHYVGGGAMSLEENKADLERVIAAYALPGNTFWVWAVERKRDADVIGTCALVVNDQEECEIGFRIRQRFWRNGYGNEVTQALIRFAMKEMKVKTLVAYVDKANVASVKILEQNMEFEKEFFNEEEQCVDRKYIIEVV